MRATGSDMHPHRQRRRRYVAAVLCLGTLAAVALGTFVTEQRDARGQGGGGGGGSSSGAAGAVPSPQPLGSLPVAYPLSSPGVVGTPQRGSLRPSSSGTAGAAVGVDGATSGALTPPPSAVAPMGTAPGASGTSGTVDDVPLLAGGVGPASPSQAESQSQSSSMTVSNPLTGTAFTGLPQVGALFDYANGATTSHFCSGSVVSSDTGDIVVTAAHCVYDSSSGTYQTGIAFVPGYHDGQQPYGVWTPSKILVPQQWMDSSDPDYDVAFLVVHQPGSSQRLQDEVGADELGLNPDYASLVQVVGYPDGTEQPITCTNYSKQFSPTQLEFDCANFPDGTSGGPFLADVDPRTGLGTVAGVIGGYQTGGDTPDISYSSYFGTAVGELFSQAEAAG